MFSARIAGVPARTSMSITRRSLPSSAPSTTSSTRSAVERASEASRTIAAFIRWSGRWIPGVSTSAISTPGRRAIPRIRFRVV